MTDAPTTHRLLRDHFLRRFLDNDLISPAGDRHDTLVLVATILAVPGLVVTVLLIGSKYLIGIPTPALTSIAALDDKFLYISVSMLVMALIAAVQWDALDLDARDAAILGPLPLRPVQIARAKLSALVLFVSAFAIALNLVPSVVFPLLLVSHFHVNIVDVVRMIAVHAAVTMTAGAWAFVCVLLLREALRLCLAGVWFRRVSSAVQGLLVLALGSALLLTPWTATRVAAKWMQGAGSFRVPPPVWFLGLYETATEGVTLSIRGLGLRIPRQLVVPEASAHALYDQLLSQFEPFAEVAAAVLGVTLVAAFVLYGWNNKRLPTPTVAARRRAGDRSFVAVLLEGMVVRQPLQRAGFYFTLQTLARSVSHRMSIAAAAAVAFAVSVMFLHGIRAISSVAYAETRVLSLQTIAVVIVLVGVRKALAIPAELRANWIFPMTWNGEVGPYMAGVRCAVAVAAVAPLLMATCAFDAYQLSVAAAVKHTAIGAVVALIVVEMLLRRPDTLPLTSSSRPLGNLKALGPIYLFALFIAAYNLARIERLALHDETTFAGLAAALSAIYLGFRLWDMRYHAAVPLITFDELPETPTQHHIRRAAGNTHAAPRARRIRLEQRVSRSAVRWHAA